MLPKKIIVNPLQLFLIQPMNIFPTLMLYNCAAATVQFDRIHRASNTRILICTFAHAHSLASSAIRGVVVTVDMKVKGKKVNNVGRDQGRRMDAIRKEVNESWSKAQNPNLFGGGPVVDNSGKIISVDIWFSGRVFQKRYLLFRFAIKIFIYKI